MNNAGLITGTIMNCNYLVNPAQVFVGYLNDIPCLKGMSFKKNTLNNLNILI